MIKPVSVMNSIVKTPTVRNFATATMLTLGVLGVGACAGGNTNKTTEQTQTEVVSKEGAEALKAASGIKTDAVQYDPKETILYAVAREFRVDKAVADKHVKEVSDMIEKSGIYAATVLAQSKIDHNNMVQEIEVVIGADLQIKGHGTWGYENALEARDEKQFCHVYGFEAMKDWFNKTYYPKLNAKFTKKDMTAEEVSKALDDFVNEQPFFESYHKSYYLESVEKFKTEQSQKLANTEQANLELIAYKTNQMNYLLYTRKLYDIKTPESYTDAKYLSDLKTFNGLGKAEELSVKYTIKKD